MIVCRGVGIRLSHFLASGMALVPDLASMRKAYCGNDASFTESDLQFKEPIGQFKVWFEEAQACKSIGEANAMCLATADKNGAPSARMVLLKGFSKDGFKFYTNYESRKGRELIENPRAALNFFWEPLHRVVRIEGNVSLLPTDESNEYFHSRPKESQLGACVSPQSVVIPDRQYLLDKLETLKNQFDGDQEIPRPKHWGGFILKPKSVEFWQGQTNRLHDRIRFRYANEGKGDEDEFVHKGDDGWVYERLAP